MRKDKKYKIISALSFFGFAVACTMASIPIKMGIDHWMRFRNPDNLGPGIGFAILMIFGSPFLVISIVYFIKSRKTEI